MAFYILQNSRAYFEQLGTISAPNDRIEGTPDRDLLLGDPETPDGPDLPGALTYYDFSAVSGNAVSDARGGPEMGLYSDGVLGASALTDPELRAGPDGAPDSAVAFNGETTFGFIDHDPAFEISQGTIAVWIQPDTLDRDQIILSKDQKNSGEGGHFRLGVEEDGRLFIRFANGDGGSNKAWESVASYFDTGEWTHVAVSFTREGGIEVYVDGSKIPDVAWIRKEGNDDLPSLQSEAYLLNNREPWIIGADTSRTENNDTPDDFAEDDEGLREPFDGAIAGFGIWGGMDADDALTGDQIRQLVEEGPGTALTAPSGPQPIPSGNDTLIGGADGDTLIGGGGDDEILGEAGNDNLEGGYGNDALIGGDGDDVLDGNRGSDLLIGGDGDDLLISRSDTGEQRIGQLAIGEPTRGDQFDEVNFDRQKLLGWEDQPLIGDDILIGGAGRDTFYFNPLINGKRRIIMEHVNADGTINWGGVAGENDDLHDHWVDHFGIDIIADYNADEDSIVIVGHTAQAEVSYQIVDTDGDGAVDQQISIITVTSNQHGGGGAHTEDLLGQIVVYGDLVDEDDVMVNAGPTHGIVETVDELQEALAPTGETKQTVLEDGTTVYGYDTRDDQGNLGPIVSAPQNFVDNPYIGQDRVQFAGDVPDGTPIAAAILDEGLVPELDNMTFSGNSFDGANGAYVNLMHEGPLAGLAQTSGTVAFSFTADQPGEGTQTLLSKDASGQEEGGHLTLWIDGGGRLKVRFQSQEKSLYLEARGTEINAGETYHVAFTFDSDELVLYVNGERADTEDLEDYPSFASGMAENTESLVFGASTRTRTSGELNNLKDYFKGTIDDVVILDRALYPAEVFRLVEGALPITPADPDNPISPDPIDIGGGETPNSPLLFDGTRDAEEVEGTDYDDEIDGMGGADTLYGGDGSDLLIGNYGHDHLFAGTGEDTVDGGYGHDEIFGGDGADALNGNWGHDTIVGGEGDDTLTGMQGGDTLVGGAGDDLIDGFNSFDVLEGGSGDDTLIGGGGWDVFRYVNRDGEDDFGSDVITDFNPNVDRIQLDDGLDFEIELLDDLSRVTLKNGDGDAVGTIDVLGVELTETQFERIPEDAILFYDVA